MYPADTVVMQQGTSRVSWRYCLYATRNVTCIILSLCNKNATCILQILSLCNKERHVYSGETVFMQQETLRVSYYHYVTKTPHVFWKYYRFVKRNATRILQILSLCNKNATCILQILSLRNNERHVYPGDIIFTQQ
jgi:hypothetical protein